MRQGPQASRSVRNKGIKAQLHIGNPAASLLAILLFWILEPAPAPAAAAAAAAAANCKDHRLAAVDCGQGRFPQTGVCAGGPSD
jgi:hypothetical protein